MQNLLYNSILLTFFLHLLIWEPASHWQNNFLWSSNWPNQSNMSWHLWLTFFFFFSLQCDGNKLLSAWKWLQASYKGGMKRGKYSTKGKHLGKYPFHFSCSWVMQSISLKSGEGRIHPRQCRVGPEAIQPVSPTSPHLGPAVRSGLGGLAAEALASSLQSADVPCAFSPGPGRWK